MPEIQIEAGDGGSFAGWLVLPERLPAPGLIVIQEIFGINEVMRDVCKHYAARGYVTLCPDLFWRQEPGVQITDKTEEEWQKAFQLFQGFDVDKGVEDLKTSLAHLRGLDETTDKAGSAGYCLGGFLAYLMACRSDADASVGYYPVAVADHLEEAANISKPLMLHRAGQDEFVPPEALQKVGAALAGNPWITLHDYPEQGHAFARPGGKHFDAGAARMADDRSAAFLKAYLG